MCLADMSTVAPEELKGFRSVCFFLVAVIAQSSLGIPSGFFLLVCCVTVWVFVVILASGGFNSFGIHNEGVEGCNTLFDEDFIDPGMNLLNTTIGHLFKEAVEL